MLFDQPNVKKIEKMKKTEIFLHSKKNRTTCKMRKECMLIGETFCSLSGFTRTHTLVQLLVYKYECYIYIYIFIQFFSTYSNEAKAQLQIGRAFVEQRDALAERIRWFFRQRQTEQTRSDGFFFHETPTARGDFIFFLFEMSQFD